MRQTGDAAVLDLGPVAERVLALLARFDRTPGGAPSGDWRGAFASRRDGPADLYGAADAAQALWIVGELDRCSTPEGRAAWAEQIRSGQDPATGRFDRSLLPGHGAPHATGFATATGCRGSSEAGGRRDTDRRLDADEKPYRIDRGRVIADPDYPNFPFMVRRGMVVTKEIRPDTEGCAGGAAGRRGYASPMASPPLRVLVAGATGYIGQHVVRELVARGHEVRCIVRARSGVGGSQAPARARTLLAGAEVRVAEVSDAPSLRAQGLGDAPVDAVVSCLASRSGAPADAWRVDHDANRHLLEAAGEAGARHFVLLSAICVQKPRLAFQHAKLAFERALVESGLDYSIVRPTAFFKSLSGQIDAVRRGRPFALFGDGERTACKPIAEADLARYLADCLVDPGRRNAVLPIGGPGPPITPRQQGELLFALLGRPPRFRRVPVGVLDAAAAALELGGRVVPRLRAKAELARIGRYYATESMLVWDERRARYDADATPAFGETTLRDFYERVLHEGLAGQELGDHAVFARG